MRFADSMHQQDCHRPGTITATCRVGDSVSEKRAREVNMGLRGALQLAVEWLVSIDWGRHCWMTGALS